MENAQVYDDAIAKLFEMLRSQFGSQFNGFYEGDPIDIPKANLPAIIIEKLTGSLSLTNAPTGHDRFIETISIRVIYNKADDLGSDDQTDLTERKLRRFIEARNRSTGQYLAGTLLHEIRTHLTLSNVQFNADVEINYDINPRPNMATSEGQVILTSTGLIQVDGRD